MLDEMIKVSYQHGMGPAFINGLTTIVFFAFDPLASRLLVLVPILSNTLSLGVRQSDLRTQVTLSPSQILISPTTHLKACQVPLRVRRCPYLDRGLSAGR
jgi:hypothetical protein